MKTYIWHKKKGYFVTCDEEIDAEYWAGQIGTTLADFYEGKWVRLSEEQATFHKEHPEANVKEVWDMIIIPTPHPIDDPVQKAKDYKLSELDFYDKSYAVNGFDVIDSSYIPQVIEPVDGEEPVEDNGGTITSWLTPAERANYRSSIDAAELVGLTEVSFYIGEMPITLSVQNAKLMLAQIQLYADQCFMVTKHHKAAIEALDTVKDINAYDFSVGYPTRLQFTI